LGRDLSIPNIVPELNGNDIPDELPAELVPPSHRDLDTSVNFVKNLLQNEPSRARSPSGLDAPVSRLPNRSLLSSSAPGAGGRQDATVYKHTDEEPVGGYYTPRSRHLDRSAVRASSDRDSPAADLNDMKRQLENTARMLDRATEESALRTAEDDALDREMSDLKWKVQRVQEDLEYASRGPRSLRADEDRRRLERELLELMHERVPAVERKLADREERRARQKRELDRDRDRRNETFGRFSDRDRDRDRYGSSYSRDADAGGYTSSYDRDRGRDRDYRDDRSRDFDRDRSYRDRSRSWDRKYDRERARSPPAAARSPPPPPPPAASVPVVSKPPPAPPTPAKSPAANVKNMTPEERRAFIQAEAQRRTAERMAAMGLTATPSSSTPKPSLDTSTEDRLAREKKEAEEKARAAEEAAAERARQRDERLRNERGRSSSTPASPAPATPSAPAATPPKVPPPVKPRAPAPPPPRKPSAGVAARSPAGNVPPKISPLVVAPAVLKPTPPSAPAPPAIDPDEEKLRAREQALLKQKEERLARIRRLEEEEREEEAQKHREEAARRQRELEEEARKAKEERLERLKRMEEEEAEETKREEEAEEARRARTPAPAPAPVQFTPSVPPPPPVPPTSATSPLDRGKNNPFNRLLSGGVSPAAPTPPPINGGNNPFFRSQPVPSPSATDNNNTIAPPAPPIPSPPPAPPAPTAPLAPIVPTVPPAPPASKSPAPPIVKTSYHTAPGDSEDEWGQEKDEGDSSEDELDSSRDTRDKLARQLFGSILPPASLPPRPQSAAASATPKTPTPPLLSAPTPPPPPAPPAPAAPVPVAPIPTGDRSALLGAIQSGARLRKAVTNDRSASAFSGRVLGDGAPHPSVSTNPNVPPAESHPENNVHQSRQSVDWYMGLAADQGTRASQEPSLPPMGEETDEQGCKEMNGHVEPVPVIQVAHSDEVRLDPFEDIDRSTGMLP
jgi:actin cytoskeleton-regulatory complex protein PAN1